MSDIDGDPHCIACPRREVQDTEIERLRTRKEISDWVITIQHEEIERLRGIVEFGETASRQQREGFQAEIARLKAALREIASQCHNLPRGATADRINTIARAALEGK